MKKLTLLTLTFFLSGCLEKELIPERDHARTDSALVVIERLMREPSSEDEIKRFKEEYEKSGVNKLKNKIKKKNILIIEDASQAHGSKFNNCHAGTSGDFGIWSFYPTKNLGAYGDGGAIYIKNKKYFKKILLLRNQGMLNKDKSVLIGYNSRMDEIQASILNIKLKYLDKFNKKRKKIHNYYIKNLPTSLFIPQKIDNTVKSNYHISQFKYLGKRKKLINYLNKKKIQTNIYYVIPHHLQKSLEFLNYKKSDLLNCENLCKQALALPCYPELNFKKIKYITKSINNFLRNNN
jgi:dTDP-4-amino-4,6-dideoxygalactose transaminase